MDERMADRVRKFRRASRRKRLSTLVDSGQRGDGPKKSKSRRRSSLSRSKISKKRRRSSVKGGRRLSGRLSIADAVGSASALRGSTIFSSNAERVSARISFARNRLSKHSRRVSAVEPVTKHRLELKLSTMNVEAMVKPKLQGRRSFSARRHSMPISEAMKTREMNRLKLEREIIDSEVSYVNALQQLLARFIDPIIKEIKPGYHSILLSSIPELVVFHRGFLREMLSNQKANIGLLSAFGWIIDQRTHFIEIYSRILRDYDTIIYLIESELCRIPNVNRFLRGLDGKSFADYAIVAVQRPPRYMLLAQEMQKDSLPQQSLLADYTLSAVRDINMTVRDISKVNCSPLFKSSIFIISNF